MKTRTDLLNHLIKKNNYKTYLEIGVAGGENLHNIQCNYKDSVDPDLNSAAKYKMTSDDFFKNNDRSYDLIFIDGLHLCLQVYADIQNAARFLNKGGSIVCHDMNPPNEEIQKVPRKGNSLWTGDCWKAWLMLRSREPYLSMFVVDIDYGCGVIQKGFQNTIELLPKHLSYDFLDKDRKYLLNLISAEDFINERYNL